MSNYMKWVSKEDAKRYAIQHPECIVNYLGVDTEALTLSFDNKYTYCFGIFSHHYSKTPTHTFDEDWNLVPIAEVDDVVVEPKEEKTGAVRTEVIQNVTLKMSAPEFLQKAEKLMRDRAHTYDKDGNFEGERSAGKIVAAFNAITGKDLTESEGWLFLQLMKDVRQWSTNSYHADSAEDCVSYAALKGEALSHGR